MDIIYLLKNIIIIIFTIFIVVATIYIWLGGNDDMDEIIKIFDREIDKVTKEGKDK